MRPVSPHRDLTYSTVCLCALALVVLAAVAPSARAQMGCAENQNVDVVPSTTLDPNDASQNEMSQILFCTDDTPNTETAIETVAPDPDFSNPGWAVSFDPHEVSVNPGFVPGQMRYDVHIASHYKSVGNPAAGSVNVTVTFTAFAPSDLGIENFVHAGSTVPGEVGTYSFDLVNAGPLDPGEYTYSLVVLDPTAQVVAAPSGCEAPYLGTVACHADEIGAGSHRQVSFDVRNGNSSGDAVATVFAPWASEPDDEDEGQLYANEVLLPLSLSPPPTAPPGGGGVTPPGSIPKTPATPVPSGAPRKPFAITLPGPRSAAALGKGWALTVKALKAGVVKISLKVGSTTIAAGAAKAKAGKAVRIKLKATGSAAKHLDLYAGRRARLTVAQGRTKMTRSITLR